MKQTIVLLVIIFIFSTISNAEFQVNTHTTNHQRDVDIAMDSTGNFTAVWNSYGQDGNSGGIFGQRFDSDGAAIGSEFQINTSTEGNQKAPSIAMDAAGNFVVAWHGPGTYQEDIFAQRFDSTGQPLGGEFLVNTNTYSKQRFPRVAMNDTGCFVIVWESEQLGGVPLEAWEIHAQRYDCNGSAIGDELWVNLLLNCRYPNVAMDNNGNFAVVWVCQKTHNSIMTRLYNADGTAPNPFQVNTTAFDTITKPAVAMDGAGHFVVVWDEDEIVGVDNVYARRYKFDGTAINEPFVVSTTAADSHQSPTVSMNNSREFVIFWSSESEPGANEKDIFGKRYDEFCNLVGDEFQLNTYAVDDQRHPTVATRENGKFVACWQSYYQDGSEYGIFGDIGPKVGSADFDDDGFVDFRDYHILAEDWSRESNPLPADLIDDNRIDEQDLSAFCRQWLTSCPDCNQVDINADGKVDFKDYAFLSANWSKQGPHLAGDITGNGIVEIKDLKTLLFHWAQSCEY